MISSNKKYKRNGSQLITASYQDLWLSMGTAFAPHGLELISELNREAWDGKVESSLVNAVLTSPQLMASIGQFALAVVFLHVVLAVLLWALWRPLADGLGLHGGQRLRAALLFFLSVQAALLALNTILFPSTAFFRITFPYVFAGIGIGLLISVLAWHVYRWSPARRSGKWGSRRRYVAMLIVPVVGGLIASDFSTPAAADNRREQPDIIMIGIDSLRPDHLSSSGNPDSITPNIDRFLANAWSAERAYTPLSRTFPSWVSILTGRYPIHHGGRFNLIHPGKVRGIEKSLPFQLRQNGYVTAYAIDESRFSNIDGGYGFDKVAVPSIGAADFVLTKFSDTAITNLLSKTPFFGWLFPYQYRNRAAHVIYDPADFDRSVEQLIGDADRTKPLFLATHFELAHWPFTWRASDNYTAPDNRLLATKSPENYQKAVYRADQQFQALIDTLKRNGRLENAIVVVLSDHGEGFSDFARHIQPASPQHVLPLPIFAFHGVNVLDEAQTRTVLAFRTFGKKLIMQEPERQSVASLVDVAPTVLALAGLTQVQMDADGCALVTGKPGAPTCPPDRAVLTESGFYVQAMMKPGGIDESAVAREAQTYYDISPNGRLVIKNEHLDNLLRIKQRAAISGNWLVASMPFDEKRHFIFARLDQHIYWNAEMIESFPASADLAQALTQFCRSYSVDDVSVEDFCFDKYSAR